MNKYSFQTNVFNAIIFNRYITFVVIVHPILYTPVKPEYDKFLCIDYKVLEQSYAYFYPLSFTMNLK